MKENTNTTGKTMPKQIVRPCTTKQLAALYNVSPYTIRKWLKPCAHKIGIRIGYTYTVLQVLIILEFLGPPPESE